MPFQEIVPDASPLRQTAYGLLSGPVLTSGQAADHNLFYFPIDKTAFLLNNEPLSGGEHVLLFFCVPNT